MTRDEVIRLAREAGLPVVNVDGVEEIAEGDWYTLQTEAIERFAALVAAQERDRIIKANAPEIERINAYLKQDTAMLKQALDALEDSAYCVQNNYLPDRMGHDWDETIFALRERLGEKK